MFNSLTLMGNITRDPETKNVGESTVTEFGIAVNRRWKTKNGEDKEEVCFMDCKSWGKTGETIAKFFTKGKPILVDGRISQATWEDKNGGGKRSKHEMIVDTFSFVGSKSDGEAAGGQSESPRPTSKGPQERAADLRAQRPSKPAMASAPFGDEQEFDPDSIPF